MERWQGKIAVVTGASAGIGAAIAIDLVKAHMVVVALARRIQRLHDMRAELPDNLRSLFHPVECDVTDELAVKQTFQWIEEHFNSGVHVLVNNAGVVKKTELIKADNTADIRQTVDTNIMGVVYCTREAFITMRSHSIDDGHVIIINSVAGHLTPYFGPIFPSFNIYPATKHAVTSMVEIYRQEFMRHNTKIRVTSISPGVVDTDIFPNDMEEMVKTQMPMLKSEDVSNAVLFALAAPPHVQIYELIIKPLGELV